MKLFKRSFHYAIGVLALAFGTLLPSCTQESFIESQEDEGIEMVIHVGDQTRTTNNGTGTLWAEGDKLTVIHSAPGGSDFWASRFTKNAGENSFTGKVKRLSATNDWYVVYPYQADNVDPGQLSFTFPANQTQAGNASRAHLAGEHFPLVAKSLNLSRGTQLNVTMQNVLHVLEFDFENKTESAHPVVVNEVQFTATSAIAGSFNVDLTGDNPVVTAGSGATKVVTLAVTNGASINANGTSTFYMAIAPFTAPAGSELKVKVTATDTQTNSTVVFYRTITAGENGITFSPGIIQQIGVEFDENHSQNPDAGSGTEVELPVGGEPEDGVYLLVYENGANSYAFAAFDEYKSQHYAIPVVVENGVVLPQDGIDLARFAVELENTGEEHPNDAGHDAYNVRNSEGKFVFYATAGGTYEAADALHIMDINEMDVQGTTYKYYHTFEQTTDGVRIVCSIATGGNKYLFSYTATDGFNYQQDNASGTNLHLFLLGGSVKEKQNPYFDPNTVSYDLDNPPSEFPYPDLKDAYTDIAGWVSSDTNVAEVNENGIVTIKNAGSTIITATLAANDTYYGATAQYTITVTAKPLTPQNLSFTDDTIIWTIGEDNHEFEGSYVFPQTVLNAKTSPVTYESSNPSVAEIVDNNKIKIIGTGQTSIKATAPRSGDYEYGEASYTLIIRQPISGDFVDLDVVYNNGYSFNLENDSVKNFLDNGVSNYTDDNYTGDNSVTNIAAYAPEISGWGGWGGSSTLSPRVDIPAPVTITWGTASVGTTTITIYSDEDLTNVVWTQDATSGKTSDDVYNLIPGLRYYCTVVDQSGTLLQGTFTTSGRRRMLLISDERSQDNANNCRDLGGMITKDGKQRIRYGMIYRGTNLTGLSRKEKQYLAEVLNIGLDNDLRDSGNINSATGSSSSRNNPFLESDYSVVFYPNAPISYSDIVYCGPGYGTSIGSTSGSSLTNPERVKQTMQAFIDCAKRGKASYFHCYIGSDRTGYWGLLLEGLLGVSAKDCSIDFELTSFANDRTSGNRERTSGTYKDGMNFFKGLSYYSGFANDPDHQLQKTITKYLIETVGISEDDINTFKSLLLEDI